MKKLLILVLLTISTFVQGQARIGYSEADLRSDKELSKFVIKSDVTKEGEVYLYFESSNIIVIYGMQDGNSVYTSIIPKSIGTVQAYVEIYNKQYVIVNATKWLQYTSNGILECNLIVADNGVQFFKWERYNQ